VDFEQRVASIAALAEPVRRALYRFVSSQPLPVSREEAAAGVGVAHHVAKFNLDKLEEDGLLEVEYSRPAGKGGPGAGRPAKRYRRTSREIEVSLPERHYDLAGKLMAQAIVDAAGGDVGPALSSAAREAGRELGSQVKVRAGAGAKGALSAVCAVLEEQGYEPQLTGKTVTLANCPFHALAQQHTELVCGMNLDLLDGLLEATGRDDLEAALEPAPGRCCVTISTAL
jgi:predicted ArsR family transcriptional regulator